jgi:hypothetical protein
MLTEQEQKKFLLDKISKSVDFKYPEPPSLHGKLKDRWVFKNAEDDNVVYWNIMDLIRFENDDEDWVRMTYYRYKKRAIPPKKRVGWVFAGQTSLASPISQFSEFFIDAIKGKEWIRQFFKNIFKQCAKELE